MKTAIVALECHQRGLEGSKERLVVGQDEACMTEKRTRLPSKEAPALAVDTLSMSVNKQSTNTSEGRADDR